MMKKLDWRCGGLGKRGEVREKFEEKRMNCVESKTIDYKVSTIRNKN